MEVASFYPSTIWTSCGMPRRLVRVVQVLYIYAWGEPPNLQSREVRTREKQGMGVHGVTTQNSTIIILIRPWVL